MKRLLYILMLMLMSQQAHAINAAFSNATVTVNDAVLTNSPPTLLQVEKLITSTSPNYFNGYGLTLSGTTFAVDSNALQTTFPILQTDPPITIVNTVTNPVQIAIVSQPTPTIVITNASFYTYTNSTYLIISNGIYSVGLGGDTQAIFIASNTGCSNCVLTTTVIAGVTNQTWLMPVAGGGGGGVTNGDASIVMGFIGTSQSVAVASSIQSGAALGATALQPNAVSSTVTNPQITIVGGQITVASSLPEPVPPTLPVAGVTNIDGSITTPTGSGGTQIVSVASSIQKEAASVGQHSNNWDGASLTASTALQTLQGSNALLGSFSSGGVGIENVSTGIPPIFASTTSQNGGVNTSLWPFVTSVAGSNAPAGALALGGNGLLNYGTQSSGGGTVTYQDTNIFRTCDGNGSEVLYSSQLSTVKGVILGIIPMVDPAGGDNGGPTYWYTVQKVISNSVQIGVVYYSNSAGAPEPEVNLQLTNSVHFF